MSETTRGAEHGTRDDAGPDSDPAVLDDGPTADEALEETTDGGAPAPTAPPVQPALNTGHYPHFYGVEPLPGGGAPLAVVLGNCQAESLRMFLGDDDVRTVRIPAVHELTEVDLPHLHRLLAQTDVLVSQPVRADYHGLPLGTAQLSDRLRRGGRVVRVPVIRFAGLYPEHAIVRPPSDPSLSPPIAEYHDLRVLAEAAARAEGSPVPRPELTPERVRAIGEESLRQLRLREEANATVVASDLFASPGFAQMRTLNHPGNTVWEALADRVRAELGVGAHTADPGRPVLDSIHAPREAAVIEAYGLVGESPRDHWVIGGVEVPAAAVREAHLAWYAEHPEAVAAGLARHADALRVLGLRG